MAVLGQPASPVYWDELGKMLIISFYGLFWLLAEIEAFSWWLENHNGPFIEA